MGDPCGMEKQSNYDPGWVRRHFDTLGMDEWERLIASPVAEVSLHIHTHYLCKHVMPGSHVLEIGAGAGRFTWVLAELGARVLVADISPGQLDLNRQHAQQYGFAGAVEGWRRLDMCDMSCFADAIFDCVIAYGGPLSYVLDERDQALAECVRVLKPGGKLIASVMALWGNAHDRLSSVLSLPAEDNKKVTDSGDILPGSFDDSRHFMHMFRAQELRQWWIRTGLTMLGMSASNCLSLRWSEYLTEIRADAAKWEELLRMELEACAEAGCLDMGTHLIAVAATPEL